MEDRCVMCGDIIPEGRMVCPVCEERVLTRKEVAAVQIRTRLRESQSGAGNRLALDKICEQRQRVRSVGCERVRQRLQLLRLRSEQLSLRPGLRHRSESNQIISARHAGRRRSKGETNMGLMDAITAEDRVQLKVSDLETLMKNAAKADLIFNGIRAEVPHRYMREIITGKKEEDADETKASKETEGQEHETTD